MRRVAHQQQLSYRHAQSWGPKLSEPLALKRRSLMRHPFVAEASFAVFGEKYE